jgi:hypothetical protein
MMRATDFDGIAADFVRAVDALTDAIVSAGAPDRQVAGALASGLLLLMSYNRTGRMDSAEAAHYAVNSARAIYESETAQPLDEALRWIDDDGRSLLGQYLVSSLSRAGGIAPLVGG